MKTISIKLGLEHFRWLEQQAEGRNLSRSHIVRELIQQRREKNTAKSLYERSRDLCGALNGPKDLSTRPLKGYGRD